MLDDKNLQQPVCPKCKGKLETRDNTARCKPCKIILPLINGKLTPFFTDPDQQIALAYWNLYQAEQNQQSQSATIAKTLKTSKRKKKLLPIIKAANDNAKIFFDWTKDIAGFVKPRKLAEIAEQRAVNNYGYAFNYLMRDWSEAKNPEITNTLNTLNQVLTDYSATGTAGFLGCGTGRYLVDLSHQFDYAWGLDSSFGQIYQFSTLLNKDISFWQINSKNIIDSEKIVKKYTASIPDNKKAQAKKVRALWADSLNTPFADDSFDWILSIYFTDVKPLPDLVKEVKRIIKPGGYFLHFGPLHYHFPQIEHHYAFDEFKQYFIEQGFSLMHETTIEPILYPQTTNSLYIANNFIDKILLLKYRPRS